MSKRIFTGEQMEALSKNENVLRCSEKYITYHKDFKIRLIKEHRERYLSPKEIFRNAGFDLKVTGHKTPWKCLERWTKTYKMKGLEGLAMDNRGRRGGRPKTKGLSDKDRIKELEAKVAYLKAENDFLAELRAKRAE